MKKLLFFVAVYSIANINAMSGCFPDLQNFAQENAQQQKDVSKYVPLRHYLKEEWLEQINKNSHMYHLDEEAQKREIYDLVEAQPNSKQEDFYRAIHTDDHDTITRIYFQWLVEKDIQSKICYSASEKNVSIFGRKNTCIWLAKKIMNLGGIEEVLDEQIDCIACNDIFCSLDKDLNPQGTQKDRILKYTMDSNKIIFAEKDMIPELAKKIKALALAEQS